MAACNYSKMVLFYLLKSTYIYLLKSTYMKYQGCITKVLANIFPNKVK